ncbi:MAG: DUF4411 family protein [Actinobacteria bacterium]|uniref:Unannotated protein n=1 Tax=freshwater metagenome TaxID=449393 RepID=A0A6J6E0H9_9ZZZZ|nr:DUF4411 family protein [Actinomycetota bacterium]
MAWLLDTNVLVNAKRDYYGFEFCPAFWEWLDLVWAEGKVASIEAVYDELVDYGDQLSDWARDHRAFFLAPGAAEVAAMARVNGWAAASADYTLSAKQEFATAADSALLAYALAGGHTVVTHEVPAQAKKRIPIPNAAAALGVACASPWRMLREERPLFVLGQVS